MNSMKKKAGELASMVMEDGMGDEPMRRELGRIELSLQAQIKELKGFVTGMNSMCGAALAAGQIYRDEGGDGKLAAAVRRAPCLSRLSLRLAPPPRRTLLARTLLARTLLTRRRISFCTALRCRADDRQRHDQEPGDLAEHRGAAPDPRRAGADQDLPR